MGLEGGVYMYNKMTPPPNFIHFWVLFEGGPKFGHQQNRSAIDLNKAVLPWRHTFFFLIAFITGNSSLEPLIEGLCAQIHVNLR